MSILQDEIKGCHTCGSLITVHKTLDGAEYFIPVSDKYLEALLRVTDVDLFMHDRLRRAERIIVDLRQQLKEKL